MKVCYGDPNHPPTAACILWPSNFPKAFVSSFPLRHILRRINLVKPTLLVGPPPVVLDPHSFCRNQVCQLRPDYGGSMLTAGWVSLMIEIPRFEKTVLSEWINI
jgi:hypothetical protein